MGLSEAKDGLQGPFSVSGLFFAAVTIAVLNVFTNLWFGYFIAVYWLLLQCFLWKIFYHCFKCTPKEVDPLNVMGAITFSLVFSLISFSLLLDLIPENSSSNAYIVPDILSKHECSQIIGVADAHAREYGWTTGRHTYYPTTDLAVDSILKNITCSSPIDGSPVEADFGAWLNDRMVRAVFPSLMSYYSLPENSALKIRDMFIVKYEAVEGVQVRLPKHIDASLLSFNIALSSYAEGDFEGGGTLFSVSDQVIQLSQGEALLHPSRIYHEGLAITSGKRYLLVGFVMVDMWNWSTIWRKFGTFTKCLNVFISEDTMETVESVILDAESTKRLKLTSSECRNPLWVYYHDISEVFLHFVRYNTSYDLLVKVLVLCVILAALW